MYSSLAHILSFHLVALASHLVYFVKMRCSSKGHTDISRFYYFLGYVRLTPAHEIVIRECAGVAKFPEMVNSNRLYEPSEHQILYTSSNFYGTGTKR